MSTMSPPEPRPRSETARSRPGRKIGSAERPSWGLRVIDACLIALFLALTFLLGIFPLKDADYYWHLRTGDLIRRTGQVPRVDFYTFTRQGTPWIDLHWIFQVGISWVREHGGVPALTLLKAVITCLAVFLLITARRRSWPVWTMILAWLPALLVLSGRMYVRPETLSLLYLAIDLAVVCRWDRFPVLAWLLPLVQLAWVNTHGLFVLGPIVLVFALVDAALRRGALAAEHIRWWRTVVPACVATGLACLLNPYGLRGAIYPLELARTMSNPIFSRHIAELTPIPLFIEKSGLANLPLQLHLATMLLGALSFLVPIGWLIAVRLRGREADSGAADKPGAAPVPGNSRRSSAARKSSLSSRAGRKKRGAALDLDGGEGSWRISPFRLLMYAAFSLLSLQATRNSHQFAAVVGSVTAWNFAEWVAARHQLAAARDQARLVSSGLKPRLATLIAVAVLLLWVGAGQFYAQTGEGRTIGWGEEPLWFPHEAVKFAGTAGMPDRFLSYHNAHAAVFEYYHSPERENGPGRTVFTDPRLEIAGAELFDEYQKLGKNIAADQPGWEDELNRLGQPSILVDHVDNAGIGAGLLASRHWKCVWFDPIVAVFLHDSYAPVKTHTIDFGARHFRPDPATEPHGLAELLAAAKGVRNYLSFAIGRGDAARPLVWLAQDYARRIVETNPNSLEGWRTLGQIELLRDPPTQPAPRFRLPFDPVFDLPLVRATYAFRRAVDLSPRDFMALLGLEQVFEARQMDETGLPVLDRLVEVQPINPLQRDHLAQADASRVRIQQRLGPSPASTWKNLGDLDQVVTEQLARGRPGTAAQILDRAYPPEKAPWDILDRVATLHLHLGEPEKARDLWRRASAVPRPAVRDARLAVAYFAEGQLDAARKAYEQALATDPSLFEARYGLAVLEQDAGRAAAAYENARTAIESAPSEVARSAARAIASAVSRFARAEVNGSDHDF
ncbi:MAG: tetratricopeptide repeat protein [Isosphaeraceae bacterium]